ncbi:MAG: hypothetical protein LBD35_00030 [Prevotellaceae bacterium]|nr:hypothetical protein [Prevotellaceae bacterium]
MNGVSVYNNMMIKGNNKTLSATCRRATHAIPYNPITYNLYPNPIPRNKSIFKYEKKAIE